VRQATLFVQLYDGRLGIRSQLRGGGTESVRSLQGMASLNSTVAVTAVTDMNVELAVEGFTWDLHLELLSDVCFVEWAATIGASVRQRCFVNLVDLFGAWRLAVGLRAIVLARLAAWFARVRLGLALGEGTGLALTGTEGFVKLATEALDLG